MELQLIAAALGIVIVLGWPRLKARAVEVLLFAAGAAAAALLLGPASPHGPLHDAWAAPQRALALLLGGLLGASLAGTALARLAELALGALAAVWLGPPIAGALGVSSGLVAVACVVGGAFAFPLLVGTVAAALIAPAVAHWLPAVAVWFLTVLVAARVDSRALGVRVEPDALEAYRRPRAHGASASSVSLVIEPRPGTQRPLVAALRRAGAKAELVPGGLLVATGVPTELVQRWTNRLSALRALAHPETSPLRVVSGDREIRLPLLRASRAARLDPAGLAKRLRAPSDPRGAGVVVAVVDTGVDPRMDSALAGRVVSALDFTGEGLQDGAGHGSAVARLVLCAAPDAKVASFKVLRADGGGRLADYLLGMSQVKAAAERGEVHCVNLSLGCSGCCDGGRCFFCRAASAVAAVVPVCAAIGNEGEDNPPSCPATAPAVISVGAVDADGRCAAFSSPRPAVVCYGVDLVVPGTRGPHVGSGTSFATPLVAGTVACVLDARAAGVATGDVKGLLERAADPRGLEPQRRDRIGAGLVTVTRTLAALAEPAAGAAATLRPSEVRVLRLWVRAFADAAAVLMAATAVIAGLLAG